MLSGPEIKSVQSDASGHFSSLHYTPSSVQLVKWKQLILPWQKNKSYTRGVNRCFCVFVPDSFCEEKDSTSGQGASGAYHLQQADKVVPTFLQIICITSQFWIELNTLKVGFI